MKYIISYIFGLLFLLSCRQVDNKDITATIDSFSNNTTTSKHPSVAQPSIPDNLKASNITDNSGGRQGLWIIFFDNSWKQTDYFNASYYRKVNYKNDKPTGKVRDFFITGIMQWQGQLFADRPKDLLQGKCSWYNSKGILEKTAIYIKGVLNGKITEYFPNGKIKKIRNFSNGNYNGQFLKYYQNGKFEIKANYSNNNLTGLYSEFYENGKPYKTGSFFKGEKKGTWYYYDLDGDFKQTQFMEVRIGAICNDGSRSRATGQGACSHHGGVNYWLVETQEIFTGESSKYNR